MKAFLVWSNVIICGFFTVNVAFFFALGTIAENYTDKTYVAPEFFLILPVWVIGAISVLRFYYKNGINKTSYPKLLFVNSTLWASIPAGFWLASLFVR
ncbi:hypothetical protein AWM68_02265 [Fictibacillus phosphorivorans]|uniref:Uncharacterized protein n=1 Tax=Fictibacillus phosphorivorans TaxID=1221500 RepID=A0A161TRT4_9BACL|nr:hypothetical protein [Fictibacillus phosphorivorans]KZE69111.1 hypothetical protein AWM68_02265 [Fictibacillus phosphorivorans]